MIRHHHHTVRLILARVVIGLFVLFLSFPIIYLTLESFRIVDPLNNGQKIWSLNGWRTMFNQEHVELSGAQLIVDTQMQSVQTPSLLVRANDKGSIEIKLTDERLSAYPKVNLRMRYRAIQTDQPILYAKSSNISLGDLNPNQWTPLTASIPKYTGQLSRLQLEFDNPQLLDFNGGSLILMLTLNSLKMAAISSVLIVLISTLMSYGFIRLHMAMKQLMINLVLVTQLFPAFLMLIAYNAIFNAIGEYWPQLGRNSQMSLVMVYLGSIALPVFLISGYLKQIDSSIDEAAQLEGAGSWRILVSIIMPLARPILAVCLLITFGAIYTEFNLSSFFLSAAETHNLTLTAMLRSNVSANFTDPAFVGAVKIVICLPLVTLFILLRRQLLDGLALSSQ